MKRDLLGDAKIFAQHIVIALDCINECKAMDQMFGKEKLTDLYKTAPVFFKTAYQAMRFRYQIETATLFEQNSKGLSFDQFKNSICKAKLIPTEYIENYLHRRKNAEDELSSIHLRRNKVLVHSDVEHFHSPDVFIADTPVDAQKVKLLLLSMLDICNAVIFHFTEQGVAQLFSPYSGDDFVKLFGRKTEAEIEADNLLSQI